MSGIDNKNDSTDGSFARLFEAYKSRGTDLAAAEFVIKHLKRGHDKLLDILKAVRDSDIGDKGLLDKVTAAIEDAELLQQRISK